jgi:GTP pyrophosphokinase
MTMIATKAPNLRMSTLSDRDSSQRRLSPPALPGDLQDLLKWLSPENGLNGLTGNDKNLIWQAFDWAREFYPKTYGEEASHYLNQSLETAKILVAYKLDAEAVAAAFIHKLYEANEVSVENIRQKFGSRVIKLVDGVSKLNQIDRLQERNLARQTRHESLRKMFLAMVNDVRVILIELADRLQMMRTLNTLPEKERLRVARGTMEIMAPLANRLGIWNIKAELEDRAFRYLEPEAYKKISQALELSHEEHKETLENIISEVKELLDEASFSDTDVEISGRPKHIYSIYRKLNTPKYHGYGVERIYDKLGIRIIVSDARQCYEVLGLIHTRWPTIPGEFDDYISRQRQSGYQSLHTAVRYGSGANDIVEFQIRDRQMHYQAEYGIAAHWIYKEGIRHDSHLEEKIVWLKRMLAESQTDDADEFVDTLKSDVLHERVYCFSPRGDIFDLPQGATPIDFAYHVHTEVGHRCRGAKVNGRLVPLDYRLKSGDEVEILTVKHGGPSRDWLMPQLEMVRTSRARNKIRLWYRQQDREKSISEGRVQLERELKRLGLTNLSFEQLARLLDYDKIDNFLAAVGYGDISWQHISRKAAELHPEAGETFELPLVRPAVKPSSPTSVYIKGMGDLLTKLANCCRPVPGDAIIGYITRGRGATIHRQDCPNILKTSDRERLIEANWGEQSKDTHPVKIVIEAFDRQGLLRDISAVVADESINMTAANVETHKKDYRAKINVTLEIADLDQLSLVLSRLDQLPNVIEVRRQIG